MKIKYLGMILLITIFTGCVQNSMYYWNGYSKSLYNYKKMPDDNTKQLHIESLEKIISKSEYYGKKVPPGIYCEYGYYCILDENFIDAKKYFELEKNLYPESEKFVNILLNEIQNEKENE